MGVPVVVGTISGGPLVRHHDSCPVPGAVLENFAVGLEVVP